ncbi:MAG: DUF4440 domain-containing protein [Planctomycetales bacterium]
MSDESDILAANQKLLNSIMQGDWKTYTELCDPSITAFEPEALGQRVEGLPFHKFYFDLGGGAAPQQPPQVTMCAPHVRVIGNAAVLTYIRLTQVVGANGPVSSSAEETRVWEKKGNGWKHVHFHRTPIAKG